MSTSTAIIGSSVLSAGTSVLGGIFGGRQSSSSGASVIAMMMYNQSNQALAKLQAQETELLSGYQASMQRASATVSSDILEYNSSLYSQAADQAIQQGQYQTQTEHRAFQRAESTARTAYAGAGVRVEGGETSMGDVLTTDQRNYYMRRDLIMYGAEITAAQYSNQASLAQYQAGSTLVMGEAQAQITEIEGKLSAATTIASSYTQSLGNATSAMASASSEAARLQNQSTASMLNGISSAVTSLSKGYAQYSAYSDSINRLPNYGYVNFG